MLVDCGFRGCTKRAAVIISILDRILFRVMNQIVHENFSVEHFHETNFFVLVCRTDPAYGFMLPPGTARDRKAAPLEMKTFFLPHGLALGR